MLFNEMLLKRRKELGMTQDELAAKLAVSRQSVSRWENGECMPDAEKLIRLSEILETSLDELAGREVRMEPIVLEAPKLPKAKRQLFIRAAAAAACLLIGAAGFLIGKYTSGHNDSPSAFMTEALTLEDLELNSYDAAKGKYSLLFNSNSPVDGTIRFYRKGSDVAAVSKQTVSCGNGLYAVDIELEPGARYDKAVFTVNAGGCIQSVDFLTQISVYEDGISYCDHSTITDRKIASAESLGASQPKDGIAVGSDDSEGSEGVSQLLETTTYPDTPHIVPFDREKLFGVIYEHVRKTYTELGEEAALKLAEQITDGMEGANTAWLENGREGLNYTLTENGAASYEIGKVVDGVFVELWND